MSQSQPEKQTPVRKRMSLESVSSLSLLLPPLSLFPSLFLPLLSSLSFLSPSTLPVPKPCFPPPPEIRAVPSFLLHRVAVSTEPIAAEVLRLSNGEVFGPKLGHLCYQLQGSEDLKENGAEKCEIQWIEECAAKRCLLDLNSQATPVPQHLAMRGVRAMRPHPSLGVCCQFPVGPILSLSGVATGKSHYLQKIPSPMLGKKLTELMKSS